MTQVRRGFSFARLQGTPLEVSAYLRTWKSELAQKLEIDPKFIKGRFERGRRTLLNPPEADEVRVLLVRSRSGIKGLALVKLELGSNRLTYIDAASPERTRLSSVYEAPDAGKPSLHITALEDILDRGAAAGNMIGVLTLKVPGLSL